MRSMLLRRTEGQDGETAIALPECTDLRPCESIEQDRLGAGGGSDTGESFGRQAHGN